MKAGRELDALIAEKVMGFPYRYSRWKGIYVTAGKVPHYSTQIADAWLVVMHFKDKQYGVALEGEDGRDWSRWDFRIWNPFDDPDVADEMAHGWDESRDLNERVASAPLAICLAALKAVEVT